LNLLLLLSALLTALGGVQASARPVERAGFERAAVAQAIAPRLARLAARPVQALPAITSLIGAPKALAAPAPAEPRYAGRRRE